MSRLGKKPIIIPDGIDVQIEDGVLLFKGKSGELSVKILSNIDIKKEEVDGKSQLVFKATDNHKQARANWGTQVALSKNAIEGLTNGFIKKLELEGVGFRANIEGNNLVLSVGFSHPVRYQTPAGIKIEVEKNLIKISGIDKNLVGLTAAQIRKIKKPEPYKGKGIRYQGEQIRRKAGKKAATAAA